MKTLLDQVGLVEQDAGNDEIATRAVATPVAIRNARRSDRALDRF